VKTSLGISSECEPQCPKSSFSCASRTIEVIWTTLLRCLDAYCQQMIQNYVTGILVRWQTPMVITGFPTFDASCSKRDLMSSNIGSSSSFAAKYQSCFLSRYGRMLTARDRNRHFCVPYARDVERDVSELVMGRDDMTTLDKRDLWWS
jgi:hypothetical protein